MKLTKILMATVLSITVANANDVLKNSMDQMEAGIQKVQYGFVNNDAKILKEGLAQVKAGNDLFSTESVIKKYLPANKKHMVNTAVIASKRIKADTTIIELNLDDKAYTKAADGYADMLNACSRCHGLIRSW